MVPRRPDGIRHPAAGRHPRALERASLAAAIVAAAEERGIAAGAVGAFRSVTGKGVVGTVDGAAVALGNRALMDELGVDVAGIAARADELRRKGPR